MELASWLKATRSTCSGVTVLEPEAKVGVSPILYPVVAEGAAVVDLALLGAVSARKADMEPTFLPWTYFFLKIIVGFCCLQLHLR